MQYGMNIIQKLHIIPTKHKVNTYSEQLTQSRLNDYMYVSNSMMSHDVMNPKNMMHKLCTICHSILSIRNGPFLSLSTAFFITVSTRVINWQLYVDYALNLKINIILSFISM